MVKTLISFSKAVLSAIILMAFVAAVRVNAATILSASDIPSSLQVSASANHEVLFTSPSGASESETITLTFSAGFSLASLTEDDVDVAVDASERTTAASCAGSEQLSVAISGSVMTITVCPGDGGAISPGSQVRLRIGTNAQASGIGSVSVLNPSTPQTAFLSIGGTFGDEGSLLYPIVSAGSVTVGATVPSAPHVGTGGGGTPPPPTSDTTAPTLSQILVSEVGAYSANISWNTNESATSRVEYGLTQELELGNVNEASLVSSHQMTLPNLQEGKTYFFRVKSADAANNLATSSIYSFTTLDQNGPVISEISVTNLTKSSATIQWQTNESATGTVDYGTTTGYGFTASSASLLTSHTFTVNGLVQGRTYHFRVTSVDAANNVSSSSDQSFQTLADAPPTNVSSVTVESGDQTLTLRWVNPVEDDYIGVRILRCNGSFPQGPNDAACTVVLDNGTQTSLTFSGLTNGASYYFGLFAKDAASQFASGALITGKPSAPEEEPSKDVCGDLFCGSTESRAVCPMDCPVQPVPSTGPVCGDGQCVAPESPLSCSQDCTPDVPPVGGACGNGVCDASESAFTCSDDCKPTTEPSTGSSDASFSFSHVSIIAGGGTIALKSAVGYIEVLPMTALSVRVPGSVLAPGVERVLFTFGSDSYLLRPVMRSRQAMMAASFSIAATEDSPVLSYEADILTPRQVSLYPASVSVEYADKATSTVSSFLRVVAPGVAQGNIDGEEMVMAGLPMTLYAVENAQQTVWDGSPYGQLNPLSTDASGMYAWYVPNGSYLVRTQKDGFAPASSPVLVVQNNIVAASLRLTPVPIQKEPPQPSVDAVLSPIVPVVVKEAVTRVLESVPVERLVQTVESVRQSPVAQATASAAVPTIVVSAGTSVLVMSVAFDFLPFLQYLFTAPILFFGRAKRKAFGVVYNSVSKEPIGLSVVRLFRLKDEQDAKGVLVKSRVTDKGGRFSFLVAPGIYRLSVTKVGFQFPSSHLAQKKEDVHFIDLYHGELLRVTDADAVITPNIPLDPSSQATYHEPSALRFRARLRVAQHIIALYGVMSSLFYLIIRPNVLAACMVVVQIGIYLFVRKLAAPRKPKSWGIVYDQVTGRPLSNVVARIFEPKYNKLLETQITDSRGRYSFLLGPAEYYAVFEKEGYRATQVKPIDYSALTDAKDFSQNIRLHLKET